MTAKDFDNDIGTTEWLMGVEKRRRQLAKKARGHVLEASAGTGRNFEYYDLSVTSGRSTWCRSLTVVDQSEAMMAIARAKFEKLHPNYHSVNFRVQSAADPVPAPAEGFDTILQTMGLCSTPDPVGMLRHFGSMLNPDNGQILLLEHGRSHYDWVNRILDNLAPAHADKHGCWWNRDIGKIVEESGLDVVTIRRSNFGTTWWVELKLREPKEPKV